ncbi:hypothetical protein OG905_21490 [Streptomyces sp. NBC_00322]|uniref:hypothetical protein n=1 Tax=unclassified Streptomyces TaxID=2593676 RepID=UPI002E28C2B2|nr:hypothetical protein [Streptomyces sp. NBC_00322]WSY68638.1 hypothetical protein OHA61_20175 [Streptomyces sp. NBC_00885]
MRYEFRVTGRLSRPIAEAFPELEEVAAAPQTLLFGPVTDEAHLYGLLMRFQDLGLHMVEMRRLPD